MHKCIGYMAVLLVLVFTLQPAHAQNNHWLVGEWKGTGITPGSAYHSVFTRTMLIRLEANNRFAGRLVQEANDRREIRLEKELTGSIVNDKLQLHTGRTLYVKQPPAGFWADCSSCQMIDTRITISSDSMIITSETRHCGDYCDGFTTFYRSLADFDTLTQRRLVEKFGSPLLAKIFTPLLPQVNNSIVGVNNKSAFVTDKINTALPNDSIQQQLARKTNTIATYNTPTPEIKIELFDNGEIDGDMITVYHNKQVIINQQVLGLTPITYSVKADTQNRVHEFVLVANNLGRIPPNTALMRITANKKTYELFPSTNLQQNAAVIIIYSGD